MDNTKKRKIVRNFVIGYLIIQVLTIVVYLGFWSLHPEGITNVTNERMSPPPIFPDYKGTTIPYNIAPLNFRINVPADECYAKIEGSESEVFEYHGTNTIRFKMKDWIRLTRANRGKAFFVTIATKIGDEWTKWAPFSVYISDQAIDSHLVYRLIEPGYEKWHIVGIYQRNLESFDEQPIIRNDMTGYNCMNCHSFCMGDPGQMMFHMRAANGGTYIVQDKKISKLNTKTNGTISNMTYPFWHPSGRYITTSVNDIKQFFHSVKEKKMEVFDLESDVVVYDVKNKEILSKASLITKDAFETFPAVLNTCEVHHPVLFHYQFIVLFKACRYGFITLDMQCVKHVHACHLYSPLCCLRNTISTVISAGDTPEILAACPRDSGRILSSF